jgi:hypothetical protein
MSAAIAQQDLSGSMDDMCDPFSEGQICGDMANVAFDMHGAFRNSAMTAGILSVLGRTFSIAANYLPHHSSSPVQLVCQSVLLLTAVNDLVKTVHRETSKSALAPASLQEGRAFRAYFGPAGLSWSQFKAISSTAIDFVTFEEGDIISDEEDSDFLYWLYSGEVAIASRIRKYQVLRETSVPRRSDSSKPCMMGIWGDIEFSRKSKTKTSGASFVPKSSLRSGSDGTTMVRIHAPTLKKMMEEDVDLARSVESVLFKSVHDKALGQF